MPAETPPADMADGRKSRRSRRIAGLAILALVGLAGIGMAMWKPAAEAVGVAGAPTITASAACPASQALATRLKPLAKGEVAAFGVSDAPVPLTPVSFQDGEGKTRTLADFKGRTILLNLWATWCAPCRHEMPALDRLQAELGGADFEVVAVNIDQRNLDKPRQWLAETKIERLAYYADPSVRIFQDLKAEGRAFGMPTTILVDKHGCALGQLNGPAEWASADALTLIRAALGR